MSSAPRLLARAIRMANGERNRHVASSVQRLFVRATASLEELVVGAAITAMAALLIVNVLARELGQSMYFAEELTEWLTFGFTFMGLSYCVRKGRHIRMGAITDLLAPKAQKILVLAAAAMGACVMFAMAYEATLYVLFLREMGKATPALLWPYWIFVAIAPPGFFFAGVHYLRTIVKNIVEKDVWLSPETRSEYEESEYA